MFDLHHSALGKKTEIAEKYAPSLLFRIPRTENRQKIGIESENLPFTGVDVWNGYEISFLTSNGLPVQRCLKMIVSAESQWIVESKSLKLYLNSLNFEPMGRTAEMAAQNALAIIRNDLSALLETKVDADFFTPTDIAYPVFTAPQFRDLLDFIPVKKQISIDFSHFSENPQTLRDCTTKNVKNYAFRTDLLRSNCPVTNQPDWADLFVRIRSAYKPDFAAFATYIVSLRRENHFHEEVTEQIFKQLYDVFQPEKLMVAAFFTRRGGIDISPVRTTDLNWIDMEFLTNYIPVQKTWRQ